ncbi:MAG: hypothetical protein HZB26_10865 [Candidatus Hydrogenedentes bacterium]|nr:hypothetical protein [Candidatus Hydrogenedentota bacterium]
MADHMVWRCPSTQTGSLPANPDNPYAWSNGIHPSWKTITADFANPTIVNLAQNITTQMSKANCRAFAAGYQQNCWTDLTYDSYSYTGYVITANMFSSPEDMVFDFDSFWGTLPWNAVWKDWQSYKGQKYYQIKEGIERFLITDINNPAGSSKAQSDICVMWDGTEASFVPAIPQYNVTPAVAPPYPTIPPGTGYKPGEFWHIPGGTNILFMDGHVEFARWPQPFGSRQVPAVKEFAVNWL